MPDSLPDWKRPRFTPGGGNARLLYTVFGQFSPSALVSRSDYRTAGLPAGFDVQKFARGPETPLPITSVSQAGILRDDQPELFALAQDAQECLVIGGDVDDPPDLNYLRDVIGMIAWFFDHGAVAALDAQRLKFYGPTQWRADLFEPQPPLLQNHVLILSSRNYANRYSFRTRGMRKFGRPDLSVHEVEEDHVEAILELFDRLILLQAEGELVPEGQIVRMRNLPPGLTCHHQGSLDDPEFSNTYLEIRWPPKYSY